MVGVKRDGQAGGASVQPPAGRYPVERSRSSRRRWFIALSILVVIAGLIVAWVGYKSLSDAPVSGSGTGYEIVDDSTVDVQFTVTRSDPSKPAACVVRARSKDGAETGRREVLIPPSQDSAIGVKTTLRTSERAFVGEVYGCSIKVPDYLVAG